MTIYWSTTITDVREKSLTIGGRRSAEGTAELFTESAGWYIHIGNISLYAGDTPPPFKKGDRVRITLERIEGDHEGNAEATHAHKE